MALPPGVATTTSATLAARTPVVTVIVVALTTTTLVAATPPMVTVAPAPKPVPVIVTGVPPATGPPEGATLDTVGTAPVNRPTSTGVDRTRGSSSPGRPEMFRPQHRRHQTAPALVTAHVPNKMSSVNRITPVGVRSRRRAGHHTVSVFR